ncbi:MAG: LexA family protein [Anaerovoracaceae bacterium]|jgi:repressor LexA
MGKIQKLADYFEVNKTDLIDECNSDSPEPKKKRKYPRIPVVGMVHAGRPMEAVEEIIDWEEITPEMAQSGEIIALQVQGDCMEPRFCDGDVVIVRKQPDCDSGDIVIAMVNSDDAIMRMLKKHNGGMISLAPTNIKYTPDFYTQSEIASLPVTILGRVIELRAKF